MGIDSVWEMSLNIEFNTWNLKWQILLFPLNEYCITSCSRYNLVHRFQTLFILLCSSTWSQICWCSHFYSPGSFLFSSAWSNRAEYKILQNCNVTEEWKDFFTFLRIVHERFLGSNSWVKVVFSGQNVDQMFKKMLKGQNKACND